MTSRATRFVLLLTALVAASLPAAAFSGASASETSKRTASRVGVTARATGDASAYWTPKRMMNARPAGVTIGARAAKRIFDGSAAAPTGEAGSVPGALPSEFYPTFPMDTDERSRIASLQNHFPFTGGVIADPTVFPYSAHGKVFFTDPDPINGGNFVCSGTVINSSTKDLIVTAGHCVHPGGAGKQFMTNWLFVPGYSEVGGQPVVPLGLWEASTLTASTQWVTTPQALEHDYAVARVDPVSPTVADIQDVTGARGFTFNQPRQQNWEAIGYPAAPPFDGSKLRHCLSSTQSVNDIIPGGIGGNPEPIAIGCDMTQGSSGGGWVVGNGLVNSVVSFGIPDLHTGVFFGPYFDSATGTLLQSAGGIGQGGTQPTPTPTPSPTPTDPGGEVFHPRSVSFRLSKHLIGSGVVTVNDGYVPCSIGVPVTIQKKKPKRKGGGWKSLGFVVTEADGSYAAQFPDKPGRYRASADAGAFEDAPLDICQKAVSGGKRHRHN